MTANEAIDETSRLLARLQTQFGDINLSNILGDTDKNEQAQSDSESSLEEPTAEELLQWQAAQFHKGRLKMEAKKELGNNADVHKAALQRRRDKSSQERLQAEDEWEKVSRLPELDSSSAFFPVSDIDESCVHSLLYKLAAADPDLMGTEWKRLYSSPHGDGLSFRTLCETIHGYKGPTVLLLGGGPSDSKCVLDADFSKKSVTRIALGFMTTDYWIDSPESFGSEDDCFLFSLDYTTNNVKIIRPKSRCADSTSTSITPAKPQKFLYCHSSKLKLKNNALHGIGIGGSPQQPRLHLTESLEECRCLPYDTLFQDGDLLCGKCDSTLYYFDIDTIEVWGVGGQDWINDALKAQEKERGVRESALEQVRRVDKRQLLEHFVLNGAVGGEGRLLFGYQGCVDERDVNSQLGS
jgi:hypothetical protein